MFYPIFKTRLASARKSARLVPMRERQNTTMSTEASRSGTCKQKMLFYFLTMTQTVHELAHTQTQKNPDALTLAMSQTVTSSQTAARSKLCTLFFTLRAILQSPQPKSATTREEGLEWMIKCAFTIITLKGIAHINLPFGKLMLWPQHNNLPEGEMLRIFYSFRSVTRWPWNRLWFNNVINVRTSPG